MVDKSREGSPLEHKTHLEGLRQALLELSSGEMA